jgi:hypothetical protein
VSKVWSATTAGENFPTKPNPDCPSCGGTGWATVFAKTLAVAGGYCECVGGLVRNAQPVEPTEETSSS